ncbi:xanthine dehydrogenase [Bombyx mori]|uniref:FAD-binding PCMH-type domain-containing protein n=1 Tax=Bombyx mori TaxID=7091 RepID=A0A8R2AKQ4_BOMMO|nr:xanthine dehydrogenase isoform X1 [Bombyx mori]
MSNIEFTVNGILCSVGCEVSSTLMLVDYIRHHLELRGTKYMCREAGCGACNVSVIKTPGGPELSVNSCVVPVASCDGWKIKTIESIGNKKDGYHSIQKAVAKCNGTQCGYCTPGWVMAMYSLLQNNTEMTMLEIEKSFGGNICRCTGYRTILQAFKQYAKDSPTSISDIEDLHICEKSDQQCCKKNCDESDWCLVANNVGSTTKELTLKDGVKWFTVTQISDIFEILLVEGTDSYMLAAGNTSKVPYPITTPFSVIIDISGVSELKGYTLDQNLVVGAGNTLTEFMEILEKASTEEGFEYLVKFTEHMEYLGHKTLRNIATIGGNLMMKNKNVAFASDLYLLFEIVGAQVTVKSQEYGTETVTMHEFTLLKMVGKVLVNILLPPLSEDYKIVTFKIMQRAQAVHATLNAGFNYKLSNDNVVREAKIVYGALTTASTRATETEKYLIGKPLFTNETLQGALTVLDSDLVVVENPPEPSAEYRKHLALCLFYKGLLSLCPTATLQPRYRSGAIKIHDSRPVSEATQTYETNNKLYPLTEPLPKHEALIQCSGEAMYSDDLPSLPHEVFASFVLSTVAVGEIISIDPTKALEVDGVIAFYSAKDIPGLNSFTPDDLPLYAQAEEVLCSGRVCYYEQPIGIIVAEDQITADIAAKLVKATYKNFKNPVVNIKEAIQDASRNTLYTSADATETGTDVTKVISGTNSGDGQYHFTMETLVCVTNPTEEGLEIHTATQWTNGVQLMVSRALGIEKNRVDVHVRRVGGAYGLKISRSTQVAVACSLVTYKLNRPCRILQSLATNMKAMGKRLPYLAKYEVAVNSSGTVQYTNLNMYEDNGYKINEDFYGLSLDAINNCYKSKNLTYKCYNTVTDTHKNTWCRAPGTMEFIANTELIMERIAYELELDPVTVRLANVDTKRYKEVIEAYETLKTKADYEARRAEVNTFNATNRWRKRGLRFSFLRWTPISAGITGATVSINQGDATVTIVHGGVEMGQGINTKAMQICAHLLKISMDKIQVKATNTIAFTNQFVTGGSVASENVSAAVGAACETLLSRLEAVKATMEGSPTFEQVVKQAFDTNVDLKADGLRSASNFEPYDVFGATLAEVEIDVLTGEHEILRVDLIEDVGTSVNPEIDIGQIEGAFVMGLGYWTCEQLVYNSTSGQLLTTRAWNYFVPQARDIPQKMNIHLRPKSYSNDTAFGSKCVGEPPLCMSIALVLAIIEATAAARKESGYGATDIFNIGAPFTPEKISLSTKTAIKELLYN